MSSQEPKISSLPRLPLKTIFTFLYSLTSNFNKIFQYLWLQIPLILVVTNPSYVTVFFNQYHVSVNIENCSNSDYRVIDYLTLFFESKLGHFHNSNHFHMLIAKKQFPF